MLLHLHGGVYIAIQGNAGIRMTKKFAQSFRIKTTGNANRGIGVPEQMERNAAHMTNLQNRLETILHRSRLNRLHRTGQQKPSVCVDQTDNLILYYL